MHEIDQLKNKIKRRYRNGPDNIGRDLVAPCLSNSILYRRGTGFFSSGALVAYAAAMEHLIKGNIKIEIICSPVVNDKELIETLEENISEEQKNQTIKKLTDSIMLQAIGYSNDITRRDYKQSLIAYLIAKEIIEIRFAIPLKFSDILNSNKEKITDNLYHVKTGYFKFKDNSIVGFDGSFNESDSGHQHHIEQTQVWRSWHEEDCERLNDVILDVDKDWNGENPFIKVYKINDETLKLIKGIAPKERPVEIKRINNDRNEEINVLRYYQKEALQAWASNQFQGILALATGTGKTRLAIAAIKNFNKAKKSGLIIVTAPYVPLALQWINELNSQSISTISVFDSREKWSSKVENILFFHKNNNSNEMKMPVLVCVNKTFKSEAFQNILNRLSGENEERFLIVDECHHFNKRTNFEKLPKNMKYRLGLSATPYEPEQPKLLEKYFGDIVYEYSIKQAISDNYLSSYEYYPIFVEFTEKEAESYIKTIGNIQRKLIDITDDVVEDDELSDEVNYSLSEVDRILETVAGKLTKLEDILIKSGVQPFTLFYCGEGYVEINSIKTRQIDTLTRMLYQMNWKIGKITSNENRNQRDATLRAFKDKEIDAVASMRVLDEGIDVPDCTQAFILASQRLVRQGVQRRGRILRKSKNKIVAKLYDFIITGPKLTDNELIKLYEKEIQRARMFSIDALNYKECLNKIESI